MTSEEKMLKYLADKLEEDMTMYGNDLVLGHVKDFGEYKYGCGTYRGLLLAKNHIIELADRMRSAEDE